MAGLLEILGAAYEVSTVVTDVILNSEYIKRKWIEEYILSIAFLVFSGFVMGIVGVALEMKQRNRYVRHKSLNMFIAFFLGLLLLRVLVETLFVFTAAKKANSVATNQPAQLSMPQQASVRNNATAATSAARNAANAARENELSVQKLTDGLKFATFVQAIVRDIPIFVIQANATIHYRKWKLLDLWAVASTGVTLLHGVASYICKKDKGALRYASFLFIFGQFVLRAGAILLVAMTTELWVAYYAGILTISSVLWCGILKIAHTSSKFSVQFTRAILFFPFFTLFVVDASQLTSRRGSARRTLMGKRLWAVHAWRVCESCFGVLFAVYHTRYTDFGVSTDQQVAIIGGICGAVYLFSLTVFLCVAAYTSKPKAVAGPFDSEEVNLPAIVRGDHTPSVAYSTLAAQA